MTGYAYLDGLGRTVETQESSPAGGRTVTVSRYDSRGLDAGESDPMYNTSAPGSGLLNPATGDIPAWTAHLYDALEREVAEIDYATGTELRRTTTEYHGDWYSVTAPADSVTLYRTDIDDQITKVQQIPLYGVTYDTSYQYDPDGNLVRIVDANGNLRSYGYDWLGQRRSDHDPDAGDSTTTYDLAGQVVATVDGKGQKVSTSYDKLGRHTAQWLGDPGTGTKLAEWTYDTLAKGQPTSATRYNAGNPYTQTVTGYDQRYQPTGTTISIPAVEGALAACHRLKDVSPRRWPRRGHGTGGWAGSETTPAGHS